MKDIDDVFLVFRLKIAEHIFGLKIVILILEMKLIVN